MVGLENQAEFTAWLSAQPREVCIVIAARAALRVFPSLQYGFAEMPKVNAPRDIVLPVIRAMAFSLFVALYPDRVTELLGFATVTAARAGSAASETSITNPNIRAVAANATARASASASTATSSVAYAANAANAVAAAAEAYAARTAISNAYIAAARDAQFIIDLGTPEDLAIEPLWFGGTPDWARDLWGQLKDRLLVLDEGWEVWTRWYERRLDGRLSPGGQELDIFRVTIPEVEWREGPAHVNKLIRGKEEQIAGRIGKPIEDNDIDLSQRPSGHIFDIENGKVIARPVYGSIPDATIAEDIREALIPKLHETAKRLVATQSPRRYIETINRAENFLTSGSALELPLGRLLMIGRSLETDAAAIASPEGRAEFAPDVIGMISDVVESFDDLKSAYPALMKMEATKLALKLAVESAPAANLEAKHFTFRVSEQPVVAQSALDALDEAAEEIEHQEAIITSSSNEVEIAKAIEVRANLVAQRLISIRNVTARSLRALGQRTFLAAGKGYDKAVEDVVDAAFKSGIALLVAQIAGPLTAIALYVASLKPFASRAENVKRQIEAEDDMEDV